MIPLLFLLFIVVPIVEIYVIIQVGQAIGALWTILLLVADSIVGARLLSWQGRRAWARFQEALAAGRVPHREVLDGVLIVAGGAFLLTPGFITDILGLILLIPPSRAFIRRGLVSAIVGRRLRVLRFVTWSPGGPRRGEPPRPTAHPSPPPPEAHSRELPPG